VAEPSSEFAGLLRGLRAGAGLTQEELAEAAGLSPRAVSDLERGVVTRPQKDTVRLLAKALSLDGSARDQFEAVARGRAVPGGTTAAMRTLPRDVAAFTGRQQELTVLAELVDSAVDESGVVGIHAISGMAGVGKTAFAVHAAHRLADRFAGGQIFMPLHGHTPGHRPTDPADALATLLTLIGVSAAQVPADLEGRAGLWRDRVAGRHLLLVLDDAADSEQVRPLLPGGGGSLVLVTSRRRLSALDGATTISLDTLPPQEAAELLVRLAGQPRLTTADPGVAEIARLCGCLPLAIGMVARQLHHHPAWTPAGRAAELATAVSRLDLLATENVSVAAAFDLSYADLAPERQRLFRRLGLHPGAEIDAYAAAALDGTDLSAARHSLEALYDQHLLTEPAPGRYRMHDLIREHARALAGRADSDDREQATGRLLDYYQHTAARADPMLARQAGSRPVPAVRVIPAAVPPLADPREALAWARAERASVLACVDHAAGAGQHARVIALTAGLAGLLRHDGPWAEAITRHAAAVQAARVLGDQHGQADALINLAIVRRNSGDYPGATQDLQEALSVYRDLGDRRGEANALTTLGEARRLGGNLPAAAQDLEEALAIYLDVGDILSQADTRSSLAAVRQMTGEYAAAARDWQEALRAYRDLGDRRGQANVLSSLGYVLGLNGDYPAATRELQEGLNLSRDLGSRVGQGRALTFRGEVWRRAGNYPAAAQDLEEALAVHRELGDRGAEVSTLNEVGALHLARRDVEQATALHRQALDLARQIGSPWDEAQALAGLGRCSAAGGRTAEAESGLRHALEIFQRIGAVEAAVVAAELDATSP